MSTAEPLTDVSTKLVTADELMRDYHDVHCDLIEGQVCTMSPPGFGHGSVEMRLGSQLQLHVEGNDLGVVVVGETGFIVERNPDTVLGADVAFVRKERIEAIGITEKYFPEAPALAVEIVSPSDVAERVDDKARRWLATGAEMVWVVYPSGRSVTVYRSLDDVRILTGEAVLEAAEVVPGFGCKLTSLFVGMP